MRTSLMFHAIRKSDRPSDGGLIPEDKMFSFDFGCPDEATYNIIERFIFEFADYLGKDYDLVPWITGGSIIKTDEENDTRQP